MLEKIITIMTARKNNGSTILSLILYPRLIGSKLSPYDFCFSIKYYML